MFMFDFEVITFTSHILRRCEFDSVFQLQILFLLIDIEQAISQEWQSLLNPEK